MTAAEIEQVISRIDRNTQGYCVYPQGYNADCVDCTTCREMFLAKIRRVLEDGGSARMLVIEEGNINGYL